MRDFELFDDAYFWSIPSNVADEYKTEMGRKDSEFGKLEEKEAKYNVVGENESSVVGASGSKVFPE